MVGILTFTCDETNHSFITCVEQPERVLQQLIIQLKNNDCAFTNLQREWNQYGEDGFTCGIAETMEDTSSEAREELMEEWMEILEEVEILTFS